MRNGLNDHLAVKRDVPIALVYSERNASATTAVAYSHESAGRDASLYD